MIAPIRGSSGWIDTNKDIKSLRADHQNQRQSKIKCYFPAHFSALAEFMIGSFDSLCLLWLAKVIAVVWTFVTKLKTTETELWQNNSLQTSWIDKKTAPFSSVHTGSVGELNKRNLTWFSMAPFSRSTRCPSFGFFKRYSGLKNAYNTNTK